MYKKGLDIPCNKGDNVAETLNKRRISFPLGIDANKFKFLLIVSTADFTS